MNENLFCKPYINITYACCIFFALYFVLKIIIAEVKFVRNLENIKTETTTQTSYYKTDFGTYNLEADFSFN